MLLYSIYIEQILNTHITVILQCYDTYIIEIEENTMMKNMIKNTVWLYSDISNI